MKKTLSVRIGNVAFTIDEDAFSLLSVYLEDIRNCCEEAVAEETVVDVESRIGDLLAERVGENEVVTITLVREVMTIIGSADNFGTRRTPNTPQSDGKRRLYRSNDKVIGGVCAGFAEYFGINLTALRLIVFFCTFFGGLSLWVYIILWALIPLNPNQNH